MKETRSRKTLSLSAFPFAINVMLTKTSMTATNSFQLTSRVYGLQMLWETIVQDRCE